MREERVSAHRRSRSSALAPHPRPLSHGTSTTSCFSCWQLDIIWPGSMSPKRANPSGVPSATAGAGSLTWTAPGGRGENAGKPIAPEQREMALTAGRAATGGPVARRRLMGMGVGEAGVGAGRESERAERGTGCGGHRRSGPELLAQDPFFEVALGIEQQPHLDVPIFPDLDRDHVPGFRARPDSRSPGASPARARRSERAPRAEAAPRASAGAGTG